jgi:hypothetical protein
VVRDQSRLDQRIGDQCSAVALRAVTKIGAMLPKKGEVEILSRRGVQASAWEGLSHSRRGAGRRTKSQAADLEIEARNEAGILPQQGIQPPAKNTQRASTEDRPRQASGHRLGRPLSPPPT